MEIKVLNKLICCQVIKMGEDLQVCVYGGERSHIGSVVIASPYQKDKRIHITCSTVTLPAHKDDLVAKLFASRLSQEMNIVVCCSCGIHYDKATKQQLDEIVEGCKELLEIVVKNLKEIRDE